MIVTSVLKKGYTSSSDLIFYLIEKLEDIDFTAYSIVMDKNNCKNKDLLKN